MRFQFATHFENTLCATAFDEKLTIEMSVYVRSNRDTKCNIALIPCYRKDKPAQIIINNTNYSLRSFAYKGGSGRAWCFE